MSSQICFLWILLIYSALLHKSGAQQIRLANGWNRCAGRVEVFYEGVWGTICDDHFGMNESQVVCKQLDCGNTTTVLGWSYFGNGSGPTMLDEVQCEGNEPAIWNCSHSDWYESNCGHNEDIGVICSEAGPQPTGILLSTTENPISSGNLPSTTKSPDSTVSGTSAIPSYIRLADGNGTCEGRVEVYHNGSWGTICDDSWDMRDAQVVCRQLNCGEAISAHGDAKYGEGKGRILMDEVKCQGNESTVEVCPHDGWGVSNCQHKEDASVRCSGNLPSTTKSPASTGNLPTTTKSPVSTGKLPSTTESPPSTEFLPSTTENPVTSAPAVTTEASDPVTLTCESKNMVAVISKSYIRSKGCSPADLRLNNQPFRYQLTEHNAVIPMSYKAYGTRAERMGNVVNYLNTISCSGMSNGIRRTVLIRCICKINQQTKKEETHIVDESDSSGKNQTPNGRLKIIFAFSHSFPQPGDLSYFVNVNQNRDIEVTLTAYSMHQVLFLHTCTASPEPNDDFNNKLHMKKNGCTYNPNLTTYYLSNRRTIIFKFKPVTSDNKPIASMKCWIQVCYKNDYQSRCYQGCQNRHKRETSSDFEHVHILESFKLE